MSRTVFGTQAPLSCYHAIDAIQWKPDWKLVDENEYNKAHETLVSGDRWLIDGYGSWQSVLRRMDAADTIVFVDHAIWIHYWWATKRQFKSLFLGYTDGPPGCHLWKVTVRLYKMMWWLHKVQRPKLLAECGKRSHDKRVLHLESPSALKEFAVSMTQLNVGKEF